MSYRLLLTAALLTGACASAPLTRVEYCDAGDRRVTEDCVRNLPLPTGAVVSGHRWSCPEGTQLDSVLLACLDPRAKLGPEHECGDGYFKRFDRCHPIFVPQHAYAVRDRWYCAKGYVKCGSSCIIEEGDPCYSLNGAPSAPARGAPGAAEKSAAPPVSR